ncbi:MAG: sigma-70 family RNA polymerase sigma factor [Pseudomonadota bacterium]
MDRQEDRILDEYLAAAARTGDRRALGALAQRWEKRLVRHAYRLSGNVEDARDIAQEAWVDIARGVRRLDDCAAFPAFAFQIVTRRAADFVRRAKRAKRGVAAFAAEPTPAFDGNAGVEARASSPALAAAMARLPAEQRAAIALFYLEDLSVAEIAAALGVPAGTVKTRLKAAREKLKAALGVLLEAEDEQA